MNLLADESVDRPVIARLRQDGHDVYSVAELNSGISDEDVLQLANQRGSLLLTADKDFGELVYRLGRVNAGVVLIRLDELSLAAEADTVSAFIHDHEAELFRAFSVVTPGGGRVRPVP